MFDRPFVQRFDWCLFGLMFLLGCMGLVVLYSAVTAGSDAPRKLLVVRQVLWYGAGGGIIGVFLLCEYKLLEQWAYVIYGFSVFLLVCVLVFGKYAGGSRRWLGLGVVSIQPSEFVKLAVIVMLARYYARVANVNGLTFYELFRPFVVVAVPFMLIVRQPDLGTAMVVLLIAVSMTLFVKVEKRLFVCLGFISVTGGPLVWFCLKGYQKQRILTFLNPDLDPLGAGYHIIQSKIAIGSGMFLGRGLGRGASERAFFFA